VPGDGGVQPDLGLVEAEAALAKFEIFFCRPSQPCCADRPGRGDWLAFGQVKVMEGQFAGGQVAADQQVVRRGGGGLRFAVLTNA
jgi:hypothetical protein